MFARNLQFLEAEEHRLLRETVRRFARQRVEPVAEEIDRSDRFPRDLFAELAQLGLTGIVIPEEYEGFGEDVVAAVVVLEELSRYSPALALSLLAHAILGGHNIALWGNEEQKRRYLPKIARGEWIAGMAITEPNAGSDVYAIQTTARREDDHFVLNGSKIFITNAAVADVLVVYALTDDPAKTRDFMSAFIVETAWPGVEVTKSFEKMGMRGSPTGQLFLDQVKVPAENLLGTYGKGFLQLMKSFQLERIAIAAQGTGIAIEALNWMVRHAHERRQFGRPIAEFQLVQHKIARIAAQLDTVRTYLYQVAAHYTPEEDLRFEAATVKLLASQLAVEAGLEAIQVLGGYGYTHEYPVERLMRDAKLLEIGAGTSEIMEVILAKNLMKQVQQGGGL